MGRKLKESWFSERNIRLSSRNESVATAVPSNTEIYIVERRSGFEDLSLHRSLRRKAIALGIIICPLGNSHPASIVRS